MESGQPLTDDDRQPWLEIIRATAVRMSVEQQSLSTQGCTSQAGAVIACSALKKAYRDFLRGRG